jgi:Ca2+-transporting ATPase
MVDVDAELILLCMPTPTPPPSEPTPWHALSPAEALARSGSSPEGLTGAEAARRLAIHGPNAIPRGSRNGPLKILWRQIQTPLIWVLLGSGALAIALGKETDGAVVLAVVALNALIGFFQEYRANRAIEALAGMLADEAQALRDGRRVSVPSADLVPGDVVLVASGDKVPADLRLLDAKNLRVEEAALTGESVPAEKSVPAVEADAALGDRSSLAFEGTLVTSGAATGVVVATGRDTELGRISTLLGSAAELETPLTRALARVGVVITWGILALSAVMIAVGTARAVGQGHALGDALRETVVFAIALAVGAIPEGLPAIVTVALAVGVQRMARRRAIVRKLPSVETLGATSVICSDKTGTLTRNEMTVTAAWTPSGGELRLTGVGWAPEGELRRGGERLAAAPPDARALLEAAALCNDAALSRDGATWRIAGDPTEAALVVAAEKAGLPVAPLRASRPRLDAIPFESEHQFMATAHAGPGGAALIVKGAPEVVLRRCAAAALGSQTASLDAGAVHVEVERLAAQGMRVLAIAARPWPEAARLDADGVRDLALLGLVGMIDPPRAEAIEAVAACRRAGIAVKMITGDHAETARAIGAQLGLGDGPAVTGAELARTDDAALARVARGANVFARVAPEHKLRLVRALQQEGHVVAMTGDGVNDAPALKQADIGVAMGITGTSVTKEAADTVLADDDFATIVAAVEEGRRIYDNLVKSLAFVLPTNLGLALVLAYAVAFLPFDAASGQLLLPIRPTQLLWINLAAAVTLALPLAFEAMEQDVMARPPRPRGEPILSRFVLGRTAAVAVLMTVCAVVLFRSEHQSLLARGVDGEVALAAAQSMAVTTVVAFQAFYMLNCRSLRAPLWSSGLTSNPAVLPGLAAIVVLQAAFLYLPVMQRIFGTVPLPAGEVAQSVAAGALVAPLVAAEKWWLRRREARRAAAEAAPTAA